MCEKHKPETRVSEHHKPRFRVWQNERVSPGPGFSKTRVSIPSLVRLVGSLGPHLVGWIGSGVRVSESIHILSCVVMQSGFRDTCKNYPFLLSNAMQYA